MKSKKLVLDLGPNEFALGIYAHQRPRFYGLIYVKAFKEQRHPTPFVYIYLPGRSIAFAGSVHSKPYSFSKRRISVVRTNT